MPIETRMSRNDIFIYHRIGIKDLGVTSIPGKESLVSWLPNFEQGPLIVLRMKGPNLHFRSVSLSAFCGQEL